MVKDTPYLVLESLYCSPNSTVYHVMDEKQHFYALKQVKPMSDVSKFLELYKKEYTFLSRFSKTSTRFIKPLDFQSTKNCFNLLTDFGDASLEKLIMGQSMSRNSIQVMFSQVLECVADLHSKGRIHEHIQPRNFVLVKGSLKLVDLGISYDPSQTDRYPKPQDIKTTVATDVWRLGCILYEMVYHSPPTIDPRIGVVFPKGHSSELLLVNDAINRCLQKDETKRATIQELLEHPMFQQNDQIIQNYIPLPDNLFRFASQWLAKYNECDIRSPGGHAIVEQLSRILVAGKPIVLNPDSREHHRQ